MNFDPSTLQAGDACLYFTPSSFVDWGITIKTAQAQPHISHIEIYEGDGQSVASRNGIGVNRYPWRSAGLVSVRRPRRPLDLAQAGYWFDNFARFQKYDWKGLFCFWLAVKQGSFNKMFCSEFALRWYRHALFQPFNPDQDADRTSPALFWTSAEFETVWEV